MPSATTHHLPPRGNGEPKPVLTDRAMTSWKYYEDRGPKHPGSCQDDPLSSWTPTPDFVDGGHLDRENYILGRQVLNKSWYCYCTTPSTNVLKNTAMILLFIQQQLFIYYCQARVQIPNGKLTKSLKE